MSALATEGKRGKDFGNKLYALCLTASLS